MFRPARLSGLSRGQKLIIVWKERKKIWYNIRNSHREETGDGHRQGSMFRTARP